MEKHPMNLHLLDFDCTEDADGVVCWDALACPAAKHQAALLEEVSQVLDWACKVAPQGPGALEDGAPWDFDLHASQQGPGEPVAAHITWRPETGLTLSTRLGPEDRLALSLTLSGTAEFAQAFRDQWGAP
jgi:hypothetical protein